MEDNQAKEPESSDKNASPDPTSTRADGPTRPRRRRRPAPKSVSKQTGDDQSSDAGASASSQNATQNPAIDATPEGRPADAKQEAASPPTRKPRSRRPRPKPTTGTNEPAAAKLGEEPQGADLSDGKDAEAPEGQGVRTAARRRKRTRRPRSESPPRPSGPRTMLISVGKDRNQIAILEKRDLIEHYVAHNDDRSVVGNIYMGRVQNVLPGMEAAFLDIGEARNAVLYAGEVGFDEEVDGPTPRIETMLKSGQAVLAQVTKDPMGSKGARLTTEVSIAGRYLVLVPTADFIGISRRLPDDERKRLRDITSQLRPDGHGLIVRTAAEAATEEDLRRDVARLVRIWTEVSEAAKKAKPPKLIYAEPELVIRVVRDLLTTEFEKVIIDDEQVFARIKEYVGEVTPDLASKMELYSDELPLFERYHVVEQIRKAIDRKVWLRSGGHIVIDRTEALTVVDVNTGRFVGKSNLEETVFQANLEAAEEVAKQLRLRDIGGIIVIDFIDMVYERNRDELLRVLKEALKVDKTRTQVFGVSELGLVQMTRKKVSEGLLEAFSEPCDKCQGRGIILTDMD